MYIDTLWRAINNYDLIIEGKIGEMPLIFFLLIHLYTFN